MARLAAKRGNGEWPQQRERREGVEGANAECSKRVWSGEEVVEVAVVHPRAQPLLSGPRDVPATPTAEAVLQACISGGREVIACPEWPRAARPGLAVTDAGSETVVFNTVAVAWCGLPPPIHSLDGADRCQLLPHHLYIGKGISIAGIRTEVLPPPLSPALAHRKRIRASGAADVSQDLRHRRWSVNFV